MLSFVQQILAFATFEVLEPNWRALEAKLTKVTTVDQLLRDHMDFLDTCLKESMLTSAKLLRVGFSHVPDDTILKAVVLGVFSVDCNMLNICIVHQFVHKVREPSACRRGRS